MAINNRNRCIKGHHSDNKDFILGHLKYEEFWIVDNYMEISRKVLVWEVQVWAQERGGGRRQGFKSYSTYGQDLVPWEKVSLPKEVGGTRGSEIEFWPHSHLKNE